MTAKYSSIQDCKELQKKCVKNARENSIRINTNESVMKEKTSTFMAVDYLPQHRK